MCPGHVLILELITILRVVKIELILNALAGYHVQRAWGCSPHQIWHPTAYSRSYYVAQQSEGIFLFIFSINLFI